MVPGPATEPTENSEPGGDAPVSALERAAAFLVQSAQSAPLADRVVVPFPHQSPLPFPRPLKRPPGREKAALRWTVPSGADVPIVRARVPFLPRPVTLVPGGIYSHAIDPSSPAFRRQAYVRRRALGELLVEDGIISETQLVRALAEQQNHGLPLGEILIRNGQVPDTTVARILGQQYGIGMADPAPRNDAALDEWARRMPRALARTYRALPWARVGNRTLIATTRPDLLDALTEALPPTFGPLLFATVSERDFDARMHAVHGETLARDAECRVPETLSCRRLRARNGASVLALALVGLCAVAAVWPAAALGWATAFGILVLLLNIGLRVAALLAVRHGKGEGGFASVRTCGEAVGRLPVISVLVPLHREPEIAPALTRRLSRLDYPRALLDICLVVEADDHLTIAALGQADLPPWMRVIPVPDGQPRTKPRAMNYALNFARGEIVGIYDAEDAPAPDQLRKVAARFHAAPAEVACLQGMLDFYNPTRNWISRCFTIEYANWFRLVLPGVARLGLV
ncbi:MAG: glycosyltransferase, partial [Jannaschia sp.]